MLAPIDSTQSTLSARIGAAGLLTLTYLLGLMGTVACQATTSGTLEAGLLEEPSILNGVPHRYLATFDALRRTLERHEDEAARHMLRRLERRIEVDGIREDAVIARHLREERAGPPPPRTTDRALEVAEGFRRILAGRERISALTLRLDVRHRTTAGGENAAPDLVLVIENHWPTALTLEPGPATLRYARTSISPTGHEMHSIGTQSLENFEELARIEVPSGGGLEVVLTSFRVLLYGDSLGLRTRWSLDFLAGALLDGGLSFPARTLPVQTIEWISLASFLPTATVEPAELLRYACEEPVRTPNLLERTLRIPQEKHGEALALLGAAVDRFSDPELRALAPALRWLAHRNGPRAGEKEWRRWLALQSFPEQASSDAALGEDEQPASRPKLSLPTGR